MFLKITVGLNWYFYIMWQNIMETSANPVALKKLNSSDVGYQFVNSTNLLAYQGSDLVEDPYIIRNKRWLEELYSYFYDSSEEDSSSEEEDGAADNVTNGQKDKGYALCRNCTVTYNQVSQVQHINRNIAQTNQSLPATITTTTMPQNGFYTKASNSQTTEGTTVYETTSPNTIQTTTTKQQVVAVTEESKDSAVTTTETSNEIDASKQVLTSTLASTTLTTAPAISEAEIAVTAEATTTLEPARAAVAVTETAPIIETAETTEATA